MLAKTKMLSSRPAERHLARLGLPKLLRRRRVVRRPPAPVHQWSVPTARMERVVGVHLSRSGMALQVAPRPRRELELARGAMRRRGAEPALEHESRESLGLHAVAGALVARGALRDQDPEQDEPWQCQTWHRPRICVGSVTCNTPRLKASSLGPSVLR